MSFRIRVVKDRSRSRNLFLQQTSFCDQQIAHGFPAANQAVSIAFDQDLRCARAGIVVGAERHPIRTGVQQSDGIAGLQRGQFAISGKEISRLAHRTHDIDHCGGPFLVAAQRQNRVVGLIERGTNQVVHGGVGDDKCFGTVALGVQHLGQQRACLGDDEPPRLQQQLAIKTGERGADMLRISQHGSLRVE